MAENPLIRSRYAGLARGAAEVASPQLRNQGTSGKILNRQTIAAAAEAVVEGAQPLAKNAYKIPLFRGVIEKELERMSRPEAA